MKRKEFLRTGAAGLAMTAVAGFPKLVSGARNEETDHYQSTLYSSSRKQTLEINLLIFDPPVGPEGRMQLQLISYGEPQPLLNVDGETQYDSRGEIVMGDPPILEMAAVEYRVAELESQAGENGTVYNVVTQNGTPLGLKPDSGVRLIPLVDDLAFFSGSLKFRIEHRVSAVISRDYSNRTIHLPFHYTDSGCFLTTACTRAMGLPDDCHELTTLRNYRDSWLMESEEGARLVEEYYADAPAIVRLLDSQPNAAEIHSYLYRTLVRPSVTYIEQGEYRQAMIYYREYVAALRDRLSIA